MTLGDTAHPLGARKKFFASSDEDGACTVVIKVYCRFSFFFPLKRIRKEVRKEFEEYFELKQSRFELPLDTTVAVLFIKTDVPWLIYAEVLIPKNGVATRNTEMIARKLKSILEKQFFTELVTVNVETASGTKIIL
ncbi:hypothetical protein IT401_02630 [Candidatus Nomurabacteria bacterium]|nr:hypothetical protein [Candidatus Nomurabacteria bacterium]